MKKSFWCMLGFHDFVEDGNGTKKFCVNGCGKIKKKINGKWVSSIKTLDYTLIIIFVFSVASFVLFLNEVFG